MKPTMHDKSTQTIPVRILPIQTPVLKKESNTKLEKLVDEDESVTYEPVENSDYYEENPYRDVAEVPIQNTDTITSNQQENDSNHYEEPYNYYVSNGPQVNLLKPIYVAKEACHDDQSDKGWDIGDEFEYLDELPTDKNQLRLKHLRTVSTMIVQRSQVELDDETPLRLGVRDRGTVECCLLKCNIRYCYLIRQSDQDDRVFVLSVNKPRQLQETLLSHYLIRINKQNNCFYMEHEKKLRYRFFPTFRALVHDERVLEFIPLSTPIDPNLRICENELWQIDYNQLQIGEKIGAGEFGEVKYGQWKRKGVPQPIHVAIKQLKLRDEETNAFAQEIRTMKLLRNRYLVSLFGISLDPITNKKLLITEFMNNGDLKTWLEKQTQMPSDNVLMHYALQISLGMSHLERRKFTHRDLACRNVLLRDQHAKIADFGMTEIIEDDTYEKRKERGKLPIIWTAPEVLMHENYTSKSDVWSFGICLIEMWNKGDRPYPNMKHSKDIIEKVRQGYVHERPLRCPKEYYNKIIELCLKKNPDERPSFQKLTNILKSLRSNRDDRTRGNKQVEARDSFKMYYNFEKTDETPVTTSSTHHGEKVATYSVYTIVDDVEQSAENVPDHAVSNYELCSPLNSEKTSCYIYEPFDRSSEEIPSRESQQNGSSSQQKTLSKEPVKKNEGNIIKVCL